MPHELIEKARKERNTALIDVMMLAASADGTLHPVELQTMLKRVVERPEFENTKPAELNAMVEASAARLAGAKSLQDIIDSLTRRLPDHRIRLLAFGLATSVALADRKATREELGLLKTIQAALGVSEDEVTNIFEAVEADRPLAEALGEPVERLYADAMVLMAAADGVVREKELLAMLENMAGDPAFKDISVDAAERYIAESVQNLANDGLPQRLAILAHGLTTRLQRTRAYTLAWRVASVDGAPSAPELRTLELLQATFGLPDEEVARLTLGR